MRSENAKNIRRRDYFCASSNLTVAFLSFFLFQAAVSGATPRLHLHQWFPAPTRPWREWRGGATDIYPHLEKTPFLGRRTMTQLTAAIGPCKALARPSSHDGVVAVVESQRMTRCRRDKNRPGTGFLVFTSPLYPSFNEVPQLASMKLQSSLWGTRTVVNGLLSLEHLRQDGSDREGRNSTKEIWFFPFLLQAM